MFPSNQKPPTNTHHSVEGGGGGLASDAAVIAFYTKKNAESAAARRHAAFLGVLDSVEEYLGTVRAYTECVLCHYAGSRSGEERLQDREALLFFGSEVQFTFDSLRRKISAFNSAESRNNTQPNTQIKHESKIPNR